jgi:hypothetical protein
MLNTFLCESIKVIIVINNYKIEYKDIFIYLRTTKHNYFVC